MQFGEVPEDWRKVYVQGKSGKYREISLACPCGGRASDPGRYFQMHEGQEYDWEC